MFTGLLILAASAKMFCAHNTAQSLYESSIPERVAAVSPYIQVYDIRDIELSVGRYTRVPTMLLTGDPIEEPMVPTEARDTRGKRIVALLKQFIAPGEWEQHNYINYWEGLVIVCAPKSIQDQIK